MFNMFGAKPFGTPFAVTTRFVPTATNGTTVKFNPPNGQSTIVKNGVTTNINTKHQCITAMKEYENKSLEELRLEDYIVNQRGKQQPTSGTLFGTTPTTETRRFNFVGAGSGFGTSVGFGTSTGTSLFGQQQSTGLFGQQNKTAFGTTSANTGLGFGTNTSTGKSLFGQQQKPGGFFGANPVTTQSSLFGAGTGTSFGSTSTFQPTAFGTSQQQSTGLFGQKPLFGTSTAGSTGFSFSAGSSQGSSNLFAKPLPNNTFTGFNTASTASSGFGTSGGGLFNTSKPGTFGFNTTTSAPSFGFGAGLSTGANMFGNAQSKPAFGNLGTTTGNTVGSGTSTGTSLFGQQQSTGQQNKTAFGTTTAANTGLGFGTNTSTGTSLFGQQQKPRGLSGTNTVTNQSNLFGVGTGTTFGNTSTLQPTKFGTIQQQSRGLSGTNTVTTQSNLFGVGTGTTFGNTSTLQPTNFGTSQQQSRGFYGTNPATTQSSLFKVGTGTTFGNTSTLQPAAFGTSQQQSGGLFETNPTTTQPSLFGVCTSTSFGNTSTIQSAAFGTSQQQSTGLFAQELSTLGTSTTRSSLTGFNNLGSSKLFPEPLSKNTFSNFSTVPTLMHAFAKPSGTAGRFGSNTPSPAEGQSGRNTTSNNVTGLFGGGQQTFTFGVSQNTGGPAERKTVGTVGQKRKWLENEETTGTATGGFSKRRCRSRDPSLTEGQYGINTTSGTATGLFGSQQQTNNFAESQNSGFGGPAERENVGTAGHKRKWLEHDETKGTAAGGFNKRRRRSRFPSPTEGQSDVNTTNGTATGLNGGSKNTDFRFGSKTSTVSKGGTLFGGQIFRKLIVGPITRFWTNCYKWLNNQVQSSSGQDTIIKTEITTNINTRHQCMTIKIKDENESIEVNIDND